MQLNLSAHLTDLRTQVNHALVERLPAISTDDPIRLREAMSTALVDGGKRLRPCMVIMACQAVGGTLEQALDPACALEMIHSYSLVHDDLPAMDNDELRRGKPTCHKQYGETTAILVGDALLTQAFEIMSRNIQDAQTASLRLKACFELAHAAGAYGMVGGQALDMALKDTKPSFEELERCHLAKTAALFSASTTIGALAGGADEQQVTMLRDYGRNFGLAFQHADDLKDGEFTMHLERAYQRALELAERAKNTANHFGDRGAPLVALAEWVAERAREAKFHATPK